MATGWLSRTSSDYYRESCRDFHDYVWLCQQSCCGFSVIIGVFAKVPISCVPRLSMAGTRKTGKLALFRALAGLPQEASGRPLADQKNREIGVFQALQPGPCQNPKKGPAFRGRNSKNFSFLGIWKKSIFRAFFGVPGRKKLRSLAVGVCRLFRPNPENQDFRGLEMAPNLDLGGKPL